MLKLEGLLKKYTEQLLGVDDSMVKEKPKSINNLIKTSLGSRRTTTYKKTVTQDYNHQYRAQKQTSDKKR